MFIGGGLGGDCVLGLGWGKEPPRMPPKVVIGAAGINGLIRGGISLIVYLGEEPGAWLLEANPITHPECHEHALWNYVLGGGKR